MYTHNPALVPRMSQTNPVHILTLHFELHFNIILPTTPKPSKLFSYLKFSYETLHSFLFSPMHATYDTHLVHLNFIARILYGEK